jgi:hypothetical protein
MRVEVSPDGGSFWLTLWTTDSAGPADFVVHDFDVSTLATSNFRFRFVFDSVDSLLNGFAGWHIEETVLTVD